jgi:hypothetical protein
VPQSQIASNWMACARARPALRRAEKPTTKAGQVRALWAEIEAALAVGQSVKSICRWLEEDAGIRLGVTSLTSYISRSRRRKKTNPHMESSTAQTTRAYTESIDERSTHRSGLPLTTGDRTTQGPEDPLAQAMRFLSRPKIDIRKIHNDGDPKGENLI